MHPTDTIAALATARGRAALAIVRVSGPDAVRLVASRFSNTALATAPSHTVHVGYVLDEKGQRLDQAVATLFREPRSATGEDIVEVTCHGGDAVSQAVLRSLFEAGARPAEAGEFTQRAFLHGKIDLAQAEAVADLIQARSAVAHRTALAHLEGRLSERLDHLRQALVQTCALVELELDFSDEDVAFADRAELERLLGEATAVLDELLASSRLGALVRDGVRVVISGRPNAGKSTLLNALVERDRAIVSATPGTTRDEVEAEREVEGLLFRFIDTAGLRAAADGVEAEGVHRAYRAISGADVLVYVVDATGGLDVEEQKFLNALTLERPDLNVIRVANKADLIPQHPVEGALTLSAREALADSDLLYPLFRSILDAVGHDLLDAGASSVLVNERHRRYLVAAREDVRRISQSLRAGISGDALALDLRSALNHLGAVTGAVTTEDVLDAIFSKFCIGK